ncbi:hypothetical protein DRJ19_04905 [Candidatus Woesearchaeota archaeon]|nr:MAG: hypothetical protein DRJ19_04905 [Candidatus Woesearchaeota archaeon]
MKLVKIYTHKDGKKIPKKLIEYFKKLREQYRFEKTPFLDTEKTFKLIKKKNYPLKTIFIAVDSLDPNLRRNKKYVNITREKVNSILKQKMLRLAFGDNELSILASKICKGLKGDEFDKCFDKLLEKKYKKRALQEIKEEYQLLYPRSWKKKLKDIYRERWKFFYERKCEMKPLFENFDWRNAWVQIFIIECDDGFYWDMGGSASSWRRTLHRNAGELFCRVQKRIKPIPTIILWYDYKNNFLYIDELDQLAICPIEMWGKEKIMKEILKIRFHWDLMDNKNSKIELYY